MKNNNNITKIHKKNKKYHRILGRNVYLDTFIFKYTVYSISNILYTVSI